MILTRVAILACLLALVACRHKVEIEPPKEPIVINLNIQIEHEVRIKVEKEVRDLLRENEELFGELE